MATPFISEIKMVAFDFPPRGWALCNGQLLPINQNQALFSLIGTFYGGDGRVNFALPDLRGRAPVHFGEGIELGEVGGAETHTLNLAEMASHTHVHGSFDQADHGPSHGERRRLEAAAGKERLQAGTGGSGAEGERRRRGKPAAREPAAVSRDDLRDRAPGRFSEQGLRRSGIVSDPYIGEVRMFAGNFPPAGWAFCDGQHLPIFQNEALFFLIGTTYGGDGQVTFALPDLRGRLPIHYGTSASSGVTYSIGEQGGAEEITLAVQQIPAHRHPLASNAAATSGSPAGNAFGAPSGTNLYAEAEGVADLEGNLPAGGSQPHDNMMPYLAVSFIICLEGIFPSQS